jgi:hypothetical protein
MFMDDHRSLAGAPRRLLCPAGIGRRGLVSGLGLLALLGCGERPREREMAEPVVTQGSLPAETSSAERFGIDHGAFAGAGQPGPAAPGGAMGSGAQGSDVAGSMAEGASGLVWQVPEGWRETPPRTLRIVNFHVGPDDRSECYVSSLAGDGGGVRANIDRWRGQMGAQPSTPEEFAALESVRLLGVDATLVEVHGAFQGMNGEQIADATMLGAVAPLEGRVLFVKLVGPSAVVAAERAAFLAFCQSLQPEQ